MPGGLFHVTYAFFQKSFRQVLSTYSSTRRAMPPLHNLLALVVLALSLKVFTAALPAENLPPSQSVLQPEKSCEHPLKRKEWLGNSLESCNDFTLNHGSLGECSTTMRRRIISMQSSVCRGFHPNQILLSSLELGQDGMTSMLYISRTVGVYLRRLEVSTLW